MIKAQTNQHLQHALRLLDLASVSLKKAAREEKPKGYAVDTKATLASRAIVEYDWSITNQTNMLRSWLVMQGYVSTPTPTKDNS